jgi:hypothetical protein
MENTPATITEHQEVDRNEIQLSPDITTWMKELNRLHAESDKMTPEEQIKFLKETSTGQMEMTVEILTDLCDFMLCIQGVADDLGITIEDINKASISKSEKVKFFMKMGKAVMGMVNYDMPKEFHNSTDKIINKYSPFYKFLTDQKTLQNANEYRKGN